MRAPTSSSPDAPEAKLEAVADEIRAAGGAAHTAIVDALDAAQVDAHAETVGRIDISFNAIGHNDVQGTPMAEMDVEDYLSPIVTGVAHELPDLEGGREARRAA